MDIPHFFVVHFHGAKRTAEKSGMPQVTLRPSASVDARHRDLLDCFHDLREGCWIPRGTDGMPMVGQKYPSHSSRNGAACESSAKSESASLARRRGMRTLTEKLSMGNKRTPQFGHGDRIQHGEGDGLGRECASPPEKEMNSLKGAFYGNGLDHLRVGE